MMIELFHTVLALTCSFPSESSDPDRVVEAKPPIRTEVNASELESAKIQISKEELTARSYRTTYLESENGVWSLNTYQHCDLETDEEECLDNGLVESVKMDCSTSEK